MTDPLVRMLRLSRGTGELRRLALSVLCGALAIGCGVGLMAASAYLIARAAEHPHLTSLSLAIVAVRAFGVGRGFFRYAERLTSHDVALRALAATRLRVYQRLERLAPAGFGTLRGGDLLSRLVSDVDSIQDLFVRGVGPPLVAATVGAASVVLLFAVFLPAAAVLAAGLIVGGIVLPVATAAMSHRTAARMAAERSELSDGFVDLLAGHDELVAFGAQEAALARLEAHDDALRRLGRRRAATEAFGVGGAQLASGLTVWLVLVLAVHAVAAGTLARVPLAVVVLTALATFEAINPLPAAAAAVMSARASARRVFDVLDLPDPVGTSMPALEPEPLRCQPPHVTIRAAGVRYAADSPWTLDSVDLDLPPGARIAIVGATGAGKSTLAALLFRFRDPDRGEVALAGVPFGSWPEGELRRVVAGVPQDSHVFSTTVEQNLRLAKPDASRTELEAAAEGAQLLDWIRSLPNGWDTQLGPQGNRMSGGERQRLALARVLLAGPAVVILDEPTAHLDRTTRKALTSDILAAVDGRTTVLITHDLEGLEAVDEVIVLDHGRVVERGRPADLIEAGGPYQQLRSLQ